MVGFLSAAAAPAVSSAGCRWCAIFRSMLSGCAVRFGARDLGRARSSPCGPGGARGATVYGGARCRRARPRGCQVWTLVDGRWALARESVCLLSLSLSESFMSDVSRDQDRGCLVWARGNRTLHCAQARTDSCTSIAAPVTPDTQACHQNRDGHGARGAVLPPVSTTPASQAR